VLRIDARAVEDPARHRALLEGALRLLPCARLEVLVPLRERIRRSRVDPALLVVEPRREDAGRRQDDLHGAARAVGDDVAVAELAEIDARRHLPDRDEEDGILRLQQAEQQRLAVAEIDDALDVVLDGLEAREVADRDHDARRGPERRPAVRYLPDQRDDDDRRDDRGGGQGEPCPSRAHA